MNLWGKAEQLPDGTWQYPLGRRDGEAAGIFKPKPKPTWEHHVVTDLAKLAVVTGLAAAALVTVEQSDNSQPPATVHIVQQATGNHGQ